MKNFSQFERLEPLEPLSIHQTTTHPLGGGILYTSSQIAFLQEKILPERQIQNAQRLRALWALLQAQK